MKPKNVESIYELTPMQQGLLFHVLSDPNSNPYFNQNSIQLFGELNILAMKQAWQKMIERHSILRTSFHWEGLKKPVQIVHKSVELPWSEQDWRTLSKAEQENSLETFLETDKQRGFNLSQPPLIRLTLIYLSENTYQLTFSKHHLLLDGWSRVLLYKEVFEFYNAFAQSQELELKQPPAFENYVTWLQQQNLSEAQDFWQKTLQGFTTPTSIELHKKFTDNQSKSYQQEHIYLSEKETEKIQSFGQEYQLTANTIFLGACSLILHRYSREFDVVFGVASSGRPASLPGVESIIGLFINTLPMRVKIESDSQLIPWLKTIQERQVQMREYEYTPLWEIQRWSDIKKGTSLFETLVLFQNYPVDVSLQKPPDNLQITNSFVFDRSHYPLGLIGSMGKEMRVEITYDDTRFDKETIQRLLGHLKTLIVEITTNPQQNISQVSMLTEAERHQLLVEWNNTTVDYPKDKCIHQLFETQVEKTPDAVAVVFKDRHLTYQQLNQRANQLAHHLQSLEVGPDILVGICLKRSVEMVVGLLGILKAGGAYVPLDPHYPPERLSYMLADAGVKVLLTQQSLLESLPSHTARVVCLDTDEKTIEQHSQENLEVGVHSDNLAYAIYTSGSTGEPKGVSIIHRGVVRLVTETNYANFTSQEVFLQLAPISFDASTFEIWGSLLNGAKLVLMYANTPTLEDIAGVIEKYQVTTLWLTAALFHLMVEQQLEKLKYLRQLLAGGDVLSPPHVEKVIKFLPECQLINGYGPTENTTFTCCHLIKHSSIDGSSVPIGRPISNTQVYILDKQLQPVPIGVAGELYIGGDGLARGYLNRPELTSEKFIPNPFDKSKVKPTPNSTLPLPGGEQEGNQNSKLYKTGDLARYLPDGNIEYIGRIDNQVKISGFRIELGEIEAILNSHPQIQQAVVTATEGTIENKRLVAYVVTEQSLSSNELRQFLLSNLPEYMVPSAFVTLETLPLTPNGKVDRKALPAPDRESISSQKYVPPQTETEKQIAVVLQEVLQLEKVGIYDNFFELGANSIMLININSKLREILSIELPIVDMFTYPNIKTLSQNIAKNDISKPLLETQLVNRDQIKSRTKKMRQLRKHNQ